LKRCDSARRAKSSYLLVILNQRKNIEAGEFSAAVEEREFDGESGAFDFSAEFFDELGGGEGGAASGEKVVADEDALAGLDSVFVDFEGIGAVFERVRHADGFCGKFFRFANGNEAGAETVGERGSKNKSASFHASDKVNGVTVVVVAEAIDE